MVEINETNVIQYLHDSGRLAENSAASAELLGWGVSNVVIRVNVDGASDLVVKQSREQLRTETDWFSRLDRIFREADALETLGEILPLGTVPKILFQDRDQYLFAMEALPANHLVWKGELLEGRQTDPAIGSQLGQLLAAVHAGTFKQAHVRASFGDKVVFEELRVDPFYRHIARVHPPVAHPVDRLIADMNSAAVCLVLADFSPKNILLIPEQAGTHRISLVDFETAHYGDPAFDIGFFLSHLFLKAVLHRDNRNKFRELIQAFWHAYLDNLGHVLDSTECERGPLDRRILGHLTACMLSRIDGTSTIDYLPELEQQELVRQFCLQELTRSVVNEDQQTEQLIVRFFEILGR